MDAVRRLQHRALRRHAIRETGRGNGSHSMWWESVGVLTNSYISGWPIVVFTCWERTCICHPGSCFLRWGFVDRSFLTWRPDRRASAMSMPTGWVRSLPGSVPCLSNTSPCQVSLSCVKMLGLLCPSHLDSYHCKLWKATNTTTSLRGMWYAVSYIV